jgi:hypothetical protein
MALPLPNRGIAFSPVGCGDSITVVVDNDTIVQIDIHHVADAEKDDDPRIPIIDELVDALPKRDGKPYLAVFGATHLDNDHICGFKRLLDEVTIGDLWFTPRVLWDQDELSDDAKAFRDEAERRIKKLKAEGQVGSGDRIRIIGYHDSLEKHSDIYKDLPEGAVTVPGSEFTALDGEDFDGKFRAFVDAPFKEDGDKDRNDTSFGLQITVTDGDNDLKAIVLGDLAYPTVNRIFERSDDADLEFDVFLGPHHCSKSVMYWQCEGDNEEKLQQALLDKIGAAACDDAYIVVSSTPIPASNKSGDNPPHVIAADRYRELVDDGHFLCTGEHPTEEAPEPIVFELGADGVVLGATGGAAAARSSRLGEAVKTARGAAAPATQPVGFGRA